MKKIIRMCTLFLFCCLYFNFILSGQANLHSIPYLIKIKQNIKNVKSINLSTIGKEIKYIPLETKPDCMIQHIKHIEISESYFFIYENDRILQFNINGRFIRQIGANGRGPEEYYRIYDFCIDEKTKEIYIISSPQQLSVFDFEGVFKDAFKLTHKITQIILHEKNTLMYHLVNSPGLNNPSWIITNRVGITLTTMKNTLMRTNRPGFTVLSSPLYSFNNAIHFMEFGIDTLYYFKDNRKTPYAVFYLDDLKLEPDLLITQSMVKNKEGLTDKLYPGSIEENEEYLFLKLSRGMTDSYLCAVFAKETGTVTFLKDNAFVNDLGAGISFWPKQIIDDNILIDYLDAFDLLKSPLPVSLKGKIMETSNPVIVMLK